MIQFSLGTPNRKQRRFMQSRKRFLSYGGARGGGKSWVVRKKAAALALYYPGIRILILRRTFPELRQNIILPLLDEIAPLIRAGAVRYDSTNKEFVFANGSRIIAGYCANDKDLLQYQGNEYDVIFLEEATQHPERTFKVLAASLRGANDFPKRMYLTCNPGGIGHAWVKRLFIDREFNEDEDPEDYGFIQSLVYDNQALLEKDPGYLKNLQALPENIRKAWLEGEWDLFDGQFFAEFRRQKHVCRPFAIPDWWKRYVALDYGMDMLAAYWVAVDQAGFAYVYRELYEGRDNHMGEGGRGHIVSAAARRLLEENGGDQIEAWLAPKDLWNRNRDTGRSTQEIFAELGVDLEPSSTDRAAGWRMVHEWLAEAEDEQGTKHPRLMIFDTCPNLIRTLPAVQFNPNNAEDIAGDPHELTHGPDALRYFCVYKGVSPAEKTEPKAKTLMEIFETRPKFDQDTALGMGDEIEII